VSDERPAPLNVSLAGLLAGGGSGVSRYTVALTRALDEVAPEFPELQLSLVTTAAGAARIAPSNIGVREFRPRLEQVNHGPVRVPLEQVLVAAAAADLVHFFDLSGPVLRPRRPFVTTVHDAGIVYGFRRIRHAYKRRLWPWALRRAAAVVAVSQFTKEEALRHFDVPAEKIRVIHSGPGLAASDGGEVEDGQRGGEPYFLYVGDLSTKKNVAFLVRAFDRADAPGRLVLAGKPADGYGELVEQLERTTKRSGIEFRNESTDGELDRLYRGATALLHPSRYEGFGFTPLEAMARGCPVLATDLPAIREVSGPGAMLLPLDDEAAWARAITAVASDEALRSDLRARGATTAARYSWTKTARELCELFLSLRPGRG
jgi:glycosyltransferase involved in cell wall biosynthesis